MPVEGNTCTPGTALDDGEELLEEGHRQRRVSQLSARAMQAPVVLGVHACCRVRILILCVLYWSSYVSVSEGAFGAVSPQRSQAREQACVHSPLHGPLLNSTHGCLTSFVRQATHVIASRRPSAGLIPFLHKQRTAISSCLCGCLA